MKYLNGIGAIEHENEVVRPRAHALNKNTRSDDKNLSIKCNCH